MALSFSQRPSGVLEVRRVQTLAGALRAVALCQSKALAYQYQALSKSESSLLVLLLRMLRCNVLDLVPGCD